MGDKQFFLFTVLGYETSEEYNQYLDRLNSGSKSDMLLTIQSAIRHANARNIYTLEEAEALSIALRQITKLLS